MIFRACNYLFQASLVEPEDDKSGDENNGFFSFPVPEIRMVKTLSN
jgi:hypothetical protein